jgi:hypothetical protein
MAYLRRLRREEIFGIGDGARLRDGGVERVPQIGVRIDAGQLRGLTQRVEEPGDLGAAE